MTSLNRSLFFQTFFVLPILWLIFTTPTTCITWWHGHSINFIYLLLLINCVGAAFVFRNYKNFYLLTCALFIISTIFNLLGILLLFFPALNANTLIFFSLSPSLSLIMVMLLFSAFVFFAALKAYTIDYDTMKKESYKNGTIDKQNGSVALAKSRSYIAKITFKNIFPPKYTYWLTMSIVTIILVVLGPSRALSSTMARNGNTPFNAIFFLVAGCVMLWVCYLCVLSSYAQYQLIKKIEQDLHLTLKPVFKTT